MLRRLLFIILLLAGTSAVADVSVDITGIKGELEENIRNHIGSISAAELREPRLLQQRLNRSITDGAKALGYYEVKFDHSLQGDTLYIKIDPGPAVIWAQPDIRVEGDADKVEAIRKLIDKPPFKVGAAINHRTYETYKRELLEQCQEYGFLDARLDQSRLVVNLKTHRATATLVVAGGARYRIDHVEFRGSEMDRDLLERLSPLHAGNYYRKSDLTELYRNLQGSGYFRNLEVHTDRMASARLAVTVLLNDAPSNQFSVGAGFGTDTGPRGKLRWERPHSTTSGHHLTTEFSVSQTQQNLSAEYRIPMRKPLEESLNLTTSWQHTAVEDTASTVGSVGFYFSRLLHKTWVLNYGATYDDEAYRQGSEPRKRTQYAIPGFNLTEVVIPDGGGIDPTRGHKTWLAVTASAPVLGADTAFVRADAGYKRLIDLGDKQLLIARAEVGAITTDNIEEIPSSQRFFTGGDQTVRGYDFQSLAPEDSTGQLIGGRYLNVASLEYSAKVAAHWRAAVFTDTGRAFTSNDEPWHSSAGFGIRWLSPVGQIRVDIAFPINAPERSWRLHIFMGPPL